MSTHFRLMVDGFPQGDFDTREDAERAEDQERARYWSSHPWIEEVEHLEPGTAVLLKPYEWRATAVRAFAGQTGWLNRHTGVEAQVRLPDGSLASLTDTEFERKVD
jgi:hypothetical protein